MGEPLACAVPSTHAASQTKLAMLSATRALTNSLIQVKSALRLGDDASDDGPVDATCAGDGGAAGPQVGTSPVPGSEKSSSKRYPVYTQGPSARLGCR